MQPLLMMRARGFLGPVFGRHAHQKSTLSRSAGQYNGVTGAGAIPAWTAIPDTNVSQGLAWTINLNDYVTSDTPVTFAVTAGGPPTGITLNADGTFSGTVTNISGAGSCEYTATNLAGESVSGTHNWTIP